MTQATILADFRARRDCERRKAIEKYGTAGQNIGGDPKRDVFDYTINKLVGLLRDAEMCEYRVRSYPLPEGLREQALSACRQLSALASRLALDVIDVRQRLQEREIRLGLPEAV